MAVIKRGNSYRYQFQVDGQVYSGSCNTDDKEEALEVERTERRKVLMSLPNDTKYTLKQCLYDHLKVMMGQKEFASHERYVKKMCGLKMNTRKGHRDEVFALDVHKQLVRLTEEDVRNLIFARREEGNASATIRYELGVLSQAIKNARRMGKDIPTIDFADLRKAYKVTPSRHRLRYLTEDELARLFKELYRTDLGGGPEADQMRIDSADFIVCSAYMGTRHNELAHLKWEDVDLDKGIVRLYRSKVKNESTMYLADEVVKILTRRKAQSTSPYIFTSKDGGPRKNSPRALKSAARRAGIGNVNFHLLRHTFASRLAIAGVPMQHIMAACGHSSINTTMRYAHLTPLVATANIANTLNNMSREMYDTTNKDKPNEEGNIETLL